MLPERLFHAESNGDGPVAVQPLWAELSLKNRPEIACFCKICSFTCLLGPFCQPWWPFWHFPNLEQRWDHDRWILGEKSIPVTCPMFCQ